MIHTERPHHTKLGSLHPDIKLSAHWDFINQHNIKSRLSASKSEYLGKYLHGVGRSIAPHGPDGNLKHWGASVDDKKQVYIFVESRTEQTTQSLIKLGFTKHHEPLFSPEYDTLYTKIDRWDMNCIVDAVKTAEKMAKRNIDKDLPVVTVHAPCVYFGSDKGHR